MDTKPARSHVVRTEVDKALRVYWLIIVITFLYVGIKLDAVPDNLGFGILVMFAAANVVVPSIVPRLARIVVWLTIGTACILLLHSVLGAAALMFLLIGVVALALMFFVWANKGTTDLVPALAALTAGLATVWLLAVWPLTRILPDDSPDSPQSKSDPANVTSPSNPSSTSATSPSNPSSTSATSPSNPSSTSATSPGSPSPTSVSSPRLVYGSDRINPGSSSEPIHSVPALPLMSLDDVEVVVLWVEDAGRTDRHVLSLGDSGSEILISRLVVAWNASSLVRISAPFDTQFELGVYLHSGNAITLGPSRVNKSVLVRYRGGNYVSNSEDLLMVLESIARKEVGQR